VGPLQANCYLIHDPEGGAGLVIDPGGDPDSIVETAQSAGATIEAIMITHGHHDHLGGAAALARATGAEICGSQEVKMVLADPDLYALFPNMPKVEPAGVDRILEGGETLEIDGISITAIATPGHSLGSITYFAAGGLFCGDLLFHGSIGRTDLPGGSYEQLAASVKRLILTYPPDTVIYPGHGNTSTLAEEKENNPFLTDLGW
jgi:glyoxylase-like metal-dependent hydrolase (beta-lactamase superfamily II)